MNVTVENLAPCKKLVRFEIPATTVDAEFATITKSFQREAALHGFRPGKVPMNVVAQRYGFSVQYEVVNDQVGQAFAAAAAESNVLAMAKYDQLNPPAMRRLLASGVQLRTFSRELLDACYKASMDQFAEWSDQNADFKKLYDSYSKFLDEQISWFRVAESTYDNYMSYVKSKRT